MNGQTMPVVPPSVDQSPDHAEEHGRDEVLAVAQALCEQWQSEADDTVDHTPDAYLPDQYRRRALLGCIADLRDALQLDGSGRQAEQGGLDRRAATRPGGGGTVLTAAERLDAIATLLRPCPPPDVYAGYDLCRCGHGGAYPCPTTKAVWHAQGLDIPDATREALDALRPDYYPPELGEGDRP